MLSFKTQFHACAIKYSPFVPDLIAVSTAQNFGIIGNGQQLVLRVRAFRGMPGTELAIV